MKTKILFITAICFSCAVLYAQEQAAGFYWKKSDARHYGYGNFIVTRVLTDFPADRAGLKAGDVIVSINGENTSAMEKTPRPVHTMEIKRLGEKETIPITMPEPFTVSLNSTLLECDDQWTSKFSMNNVELSVDPDADLFDYATFDFEYTHQDNPAIIRQYTSIGSLEDDFVRKITFHVKRGKQKLSLTVNAEIRARNYLR
ncbi:MAG: PDZ domain-containing protein [Prevotellaceae bacterium]|jgi:hypothetical protein|nr:PDZ domain-containing protein [Prevotellaceae bacterium]